MLLGILHNLNQMIRRHYELKKLNCENMVLKAPSVFLIANEK